ncbi:conserved Plasmodium protein, unknown function [Plasmodium reichenowi]|uniref:Uncharacterized protein n=1 Tax=Plasmodium reichenowi TaxID=5854 RepID=A0A060RV84_PLARE|nr:conserved Plasmodium protein, unknown function [Plasmodium reichenowi]
MLRLNKIYKMNHKNNYAALLNEEKNKINVILNEYTDIIYNNNSKRCKNKYKNMKNIHNILYSSVLKNYKNVYFYKNMLKIIENRKNDLTLHQINIILNSLIKAQIYKYSIFNSFEEPILKHLNNIHIMINDNIYKKYSKIIEHIRREKKIVYIPTTTLLFPNKDIKVYFNISNTHNNSNNLHLISGQFDILIHIFKSYIHFSCQNSLFNTLFFFITKNYLFIKNKKKNLLNVWLLYIQNILSKHSIGNLEQNSIVNISNEKKINIFKKKNFFKHSKLYRHQYYFNIKMKTIHNYIIAYKKKNIKNYINKDNHNNKLYNTIFCKNYISSVLKYITILILKKDKYLLLQKKKINKNKNLYISNGYMYKYKYSNVHISSNFAFNYLIKFHFIDNHFLLKKKYFPQMLLHDITFLQNILIFLYNMNFKSNIFQRYVKRITST